MRACVKHSRAHDVPRCTMLVCKKVQEGFCEHHDVSVMWLCDQVNGSYTHSDVCYEAL
jgi:hypothetical protein